MWEWLPTITSFVVSGTIFVVALIFKKPITKKD